MIKPDTMIGGRYKVKRHVGKGGMQDVYLATDTILDIEVALKTPQPGQHSKKFKSSAEISARINHHDVAKTLDYFEFEGAYFLVEEFIDGEDLECKLKSVKFLDPHLAARVLHHLAKGIAASHRVGVVHRDLKPSNIMVSRGPNLHLLKITDFGIATLTKEVFDEAAEDGDITRSSSGTIKGALPYMAPELMFRKKGVPIESSADIWSLGALMFRLLTGEYPFGVFLDAAVNVKSNTRLPWPDFMTANAQFAPLAKELQVIVDSCLIPDVKARPKASDIVAQCQQLCYLSVDREEGVVENIIQNGYSGFASAGSKTVFFSMESVYGPTRPDLISNRKIIFSSFPGSPQPRAHPIVVTIK
jgi:serine/threonine-protein kinase